MVGSGTGSRDDVGLDEDGNDDDDIVVVVVVLGVVGIDLDVPPATAATADDEPGEEAVVGLILTVGAVNFKPSINADITPTAFDLYNFEWN